MSFSYTTSLPQAGGLITAAQLATLFTNLQQKFGQITDDDIAAGANIQGSKLALGSIPGDRIATKTITEDRLALQSVGNDEVIDLTLKKGKFSTALADQLTLQQVQILEQSVAFSTGAGAGLSVITPTTPIPTATYDLLGVIVENPTSPAGLAVVGRRITAGNYQALIWTFGGVNSGNVIFVYMARS